MGPRMGGGWGGELASSLTYGTMYACVRAHLPTHAKVTQARNAVVCCAWFMKHSSTCVAVHTPPPFPAR